MAELRTAIRVDLGIYRRMLGARLRADWSYRVSFFVFLAAQATLAIVDFATIMVVFSAVDQLAGWTAPEVALLYGISGTAFGLADLVVSPVEAAGRHIKQGTFDHFLVRPAGTLGQLLATEFALRRVGRSLQPLAVLVIATFLVDVDWTPAALLMLPLAVVCGAVIYGCLWVLTASITFWTVESQELANSVTYGGNAMGRYPIDVLGAWLQRIVLFVVPLASVAYLPAAWVLDKPVPFGVPAGAAWASPLVAAGLVVGTGATWRFAVRHYRSTGS